MFVLDITAERDGVPPEGFPRGSVVSKSPSLQVALTTRARTGTPAERGGGHYSLASASPFQISIQRYPLSLHVKQIPIH